MDKPFIHADLQTSNYQNEKCTVSLAFFDREMEILGHNYTSNKNFKWIKPEDLKHQLVEAGVGGESNAQILMHNLQQQKNFFYCLENLPSNVCLPTY